jgi:hypothetical protein
MLGQIARVVAGHRILEDVVRWSAKESREICSIVTQDEYTHDVVVRWAESLWLVYDCT